MPGWDSLGNDLRQRGIRVNLTRMGWLGVAAAASLATIATGLAPVAAQPSAPRASTPPAVHTYHGTPGLARAGVPAASARPATRVMPKTARRLPSGHYSGTAAVPRVPAQASAATALTRRPSVNFNGVSSRDSQFTNYEAKFEPPDQGLCQG